MDDAAEQRGSVLDDEQFRRLAEYGEVEHAETTGWLFRCSSRRPRIDAVRASHVVLISQPAATPDLLEPAAR